MELHLANPLVNYQVVQNRAPGVQIRLTDEAVNES